MKAKKTVSKSRAELLFLFIISFFVSYGQTYNMTTGTITTCSGTFYDDGGVSNNYSWGTTIKQTFVSNNGNTLKVDFSMLDVRNGALLSIYDGPNDSYPLIGTYGTSTLSVQSTGTALTFVFFGPSSSSTVRYAGWEATISCSTPTLTPYTMSNGTVTTCSGVFFDPSGPALDYPNSNITTQTFSSGSSSYIHFNFTNFSVQLGDTLFAYDGLNVSSPLIGAYTGGGIPERISSLTGNSITFRFRSNSSGTASGWKAIISCSTTANPVTTFIMQNGVRSVCSGTFYDDGGVSNNYSWGTTIKQAFVSNNGNTLKVDFSMLDVRNGALLSIYDGPNDSYPLIGTYGTSTLSVQSTGTALTFVFFGPSSSSTVRYAGWEASISCSTPTLTPYTMSNGTVTTCSGVFFDPSGPALDYPNSNITTQTFSSGSSSYIHFNFTNFAVPLGDTLFAYDGLNVSSPLIGAYTGGGIPERISSLTGNSITFRFRSNSSGTASGWKAIISCSTTANPVTTFIMQNGVRSVCSGTFYDDGGVSNNYSWGTTIKQAFVSNNGNTLKVDFSVLDVRNGALLSIYDGPNDSYPLIGTYGTSTLSVQSTGTALTFVFFGPSSSSTVRYAGWEATISCSTPTLAPNAQFTTPSFTVCAGSCINFVDQSLNAPTSWNWQFQGASVSNSILKNPSNICYNAAGSYTVALTASNVSGSSTITKTITVLSAPILTTTTSSSTLCAGEIATLTVAGANTYSWSVGATTSTLLISPSVTTVYTVTGTISNGCTNTALITQIVSAIPTISITNSIPLCVGKTVTLTATGASTYLWNTSATTNTITDTPAGNVSYTVTGTNGAGCSATAIKNLTINTLPLVTATATAMSVCQGQSVVLSSGGANTYSWSTGSTSSNTTVFPTTSAIYTVTGTDANGCKGLANVSVTVNTSPTLTLASTNSLICNGQSAVLSVNGANTYSWSTGVTTNTLSVSPSLTTTYIVTGTSINGCTTIASITQSVNVCTGIEKTEVENSMYTIYPNPFNDEVYVKAHVPYKLVIHNSIGQKLWEEFVENDVVKIDTKLFSSGVYFIQIHQNNQIKVSKLIKK